jgi:hypothetical protein
MPEFCQNHPDKEARYRGLCGTCYNRWCYSKTPEKKLDHLKRYNKWKHEWRGLNKERVLWLNAKKRAERDRREFSIEPTDIFIPEVCPILGIPIDRNSTVRGGKDSPSLDRLDNNKGLTTV